MFAAVDLGSNSFRLHIGFHDGDAIRIVKSAREPVRLGAGMDAEGNLTADARDAALRCLRNFNAILAEHPLEAVRVVATNTLRVANDAAEFLPLAEAAIGYPIEIISGEEEGRLIYMGVASALADRMEDRLVIDIGGGSTEIVLGRGPDILHVESFSIGTVGQSASFFPGGCVDEAAFEAATFSARSLFEDAAPAYDPALWSHAYGTSGTIRALAEVIAMNGIGDGTMSFSSLAALKTVFVEAGSASKAGLQGVKQERLPAILGGLAIMLAVMEELGVKRLTAVNAGLRIGVLSDLQLRASRRDRREDAILEFAQRFHADRDRGEQVAKTALELYTRAKPETADYARCLYWSGLVHEVGVAVSHTGYHKHGAYLVEHADLSGFTTREQRLMSTLVLGQKGNLRKIANAMLDQDFAKAILALRLAIMLMHSRACSEVTRIRVKMKGRSRIEFEAGRALMDQHPTLEYWIRKERNWWAEIGMEFLLKVN